MNALNWKGILWFVELIAWAAFLGWFASTGCVSEFRTTTSVQEIETETTHDVEIKKPVIPQDVVPEAPAGGT